MKAIVCTAYGPPEVLQFQEVDKPAPKDNEVLIRVHATTVHRGDSRMRGLDIPGPAWQRILARLVLGIRKPRNNILGMDLAGEIEATGKEVTRFQRSDEVFGSTMWCGFGAYAEYLCLPASGIVAHKPANLSYEQAAAVPLAAMTALQGLRDNGNIQPGQKVLINGASGGVGPFAVQIAKAFGAEVTGVCSTRNLEMVRSIGANQVIDYKKEDFTKNGQQYDLILAVNGYHPISDYMRALKPEGTYVVAGGSMFQLFQAASNKKRNSNVGGQKTYIASLVQSQKDLIFIKELLDSGKILPVIDGCYPLSKTPEAFWYFEKVHPKGKVVISVEHNQKT